MDSSKLSYSRAEIITSIHRFYSAAIKPPYIDIDALVLPPEDGWSGVREDELRKRGKTDEVIALLRHLPYLRNPSCKEKWMLSPDTLEIAYCDGDVYDELMDELQPTPPHCIWLTKHDSRDGVDLLLDTHTGTITEWSMLTRRLMIPYEEYEKLEKEDKWMGHPTFPAKDFFQLWQARWEKLVWLPISNPRRGKATVSWWWRATPGSDDEEAILDSDDDFEPDSDDESDEETSLNSEGDAALSDREADDIFKEAFGDEAQSKRIELVSEPSWGSAAPIPPQTPSPDPRQDRYKRREDQAKELYEIYKRNGWPAHFDREKCKVQLEEFRQTLHR
ncbi:hypothetical protein F4805DRAFT_432705 [Annulohypoxylon moriforme]|nr:hypothetical protein F4805DRAFT_432705 [Annulohypoxylon moriforme]